jgi:hypothetical protein
VAWNQPWSEYSYHKYGWPYRSRHFLSLESQLPANHRPWPAFNRTQCDQQERPQNSHNSHYPRLCSSSPHVLRAISSCHCNSAVTEKLSLTSCRKGIQSLEKCGPVARCTGKNWAWDPLPSALLPWHPGESGWDIKTGSKQAIWSLSTWKLFL